MHNAEGRSAYPKPLDFEVMRPEFEEQEDGSILATITVSPFVVIGESTTEPGARRAALYKAHQTYKSYHPSYVIPSPFPNTFVDRDGVSWKRLGSMTEDYAFTDEDGFEDYAGIDQMLSWDIRPVS